MYKRQEEEVIDVIERKIHWDMLGFDVVGSANNGVKALELVEKQQPDVVITDIKMPYMDGLELSRRLNNDYQNIHIIIFTGFDEFEYAKEAVHLEIEEYMLKPINALELIVLTAFPITTVSSFEHFLNAFFPITVTLLPIVSFLRTLQPANALSPTAVTFNLYPLQSALSGIVTFVILFFLAATTPITFDCPNVAVSIDVIWYMKFPAVYVIPTYTP